MPVAADAVSASEAQVVRLKPVDRAEVTIVMDNFVDILNLVEQPLAFLPTERTRPGKQALDELMDALR